jgi:hypothetical protein
VRALHLSVFAWLAVAPFACAGSDEHPKAPVTPRGSSIEVSDLEIHADGVDRFAACAPPGELGQAWYPVVPAWTAPPSTADADAGATAAVPLVDDGSGRSITERAVEDTRAAFRSCYHRGLIHDPTQDGRAAIVLRVGSDGRVAKTESYGVCELQTDVVKCMREAAARLRFAPPRGGSDTIVLPVVFAPRGGSQSETTDNDSYTAAAYVAVESLRPELHACEEEARRSGKGVEAWGVFDMKIDAAGRANDANVDPWGGDQDLLSCAVRVMQTLRLAPPVGGRGKVMVRVSFNPRAGSR